jgi:hypothetical protein
MSAKPNPTGCGCKNNTNCCQSTSDLQFSVTAISGCGSCNNDSFTGVMHSGGTSDFWFFGSYPLCGFNDMAGTLQCFNGNYNFAMGGGSSSWSGQAPYNCEDCPDIRLSLISTANPGGPLAGCVIRVEVWR